MANNTRNLLGLTEGARVLDARGEELGKVAEFREGYFKVNVSMGGDYWLRQDMVAHSDMECVKLRLSRDEVDDQKIDSGAEDMFEEYGESSLEERDLSGSERRYDTQADALMRGRPQI